jgi:hypothetical protein
VTVSMTIIRVYTLQRLHNFTPQVGDSITRR